MSETLRNSLKHLGTNHHVLFCCDHMKQWSAESRNESKFKFPHVSQFLLSIVSIVISTRFGQRDTSV